MSGMQVGKCDRRKNVKSKAFNEKDEEPRFLSSLTPCTPCTVAPQCVHYFKCNGLASKLQEFYNSEYNQKQNINANDNIFRTYNLLISIFLESYPNFLEQQQSDVHHIHAVPISISLKQLGHNLILDSRWRQIVLLLLIVLVKSIKEVKITIKIHIFTPMERRSLVYFEK